MRPPKRGTWPELGAHTPLVVTRASLSALKAIEVGKERPAASTSDASPSWMRSTAPLCGRMGELTALASLFEAPDLGLPGSLPRTAER